MAEHRRRPCTCTMCTASKAGPCRMPAMRDMDRCEECLRICREAVAAPASRP